jgi:AraC-like DNA-binding protein
LKQNSKTIEYKGRVVFQKIRVPSFSRLPKEYHKNEACFVFINQGEFYVRSQTERLRLNKETALLAKCLNYFYETTKRSSEEQDNVEVIGLLFYPELVQELFNFDIKSSNHTLDYNLKQIEVNQLLELYRESIGVLLDHPDLADEHLVKNKLREFVILMTKTVNAPSELDFLASLFKPNFAKFEEVIQHNLYSNLGLEEFAALCHMSLSSFKRKFKEEYNESPAKYFTKMRIKKAIESVTNKELRISDIAYDLGYDSITTFNRVFKEQTGKSPSAFRLD